MVEPCYINKIRHTLCPLHVYCRMLDRGMGKTDAVKWGKRYEIMFHILDKGLLVPVEFVERRIYKLNGKEKL